MIPTKAYILCIDDERSEKYAKTCSDSCDKIGLDWEYFYGFNQKKLIKNENIWNKIDIQFKKPQTSLTGASCATAGHFMIWKKIIENQECAIVLEHDSLMLRKVNIDIPDNMLVALGYKVTDPENYQHNNVLQQKLSLNERKYHGGAHAYALTHQTAKNLIDKLKQTDKVVYIDNGYFLSERNRSGVSLSIIDPICAIGWLRESTIWPKSAVDNYDPILQSFLDNYKSNNSLNVKKK